MTAARPRLSHAACELLREIDVVDDEGERRTIAIPIERPLTVYVDRREVVTLMTLGQMPELMVLGYLLNQGLVAGVDEVESVTVDWSVNAAAVRLHAGATAPAPRVAQRVVTSGCGQGTVYEQMADQVAQVRLPPPEATRLDVDALRALLDAARSHDSVHRRAGSVHGCALFAAGRLLLYVEDVGRHNAVDAIAGWMAMRGVPGADKVFYTTGRLTSEMVMKAALMGLPIVVSRNGVTAMGHELAERLGMTLIGRASGRRFLCYCGAARLSPSAAGSSTVNTAPLAPSSRLAASTSPP